MKYFLVKTNYFEEIKVNTDVPYNVHNRGEPEQHITNACFVHYYFDGYRINKTNE